MRQRIDATDGQLNQTPKGDLTVKAKFLIPLFIFLGIAVFLGIGLTLDPTKLPSTLINKPAPEFRVPELHNQSQTFAPSDLRGQRWLLNVWASWCVGCRVEHPLLNQLADQTDIKIVGLNYKDEEVNALQWLSQRGDPYKNVPVDREGDVVIDYGVYGVPETFVIDETGTIIHKHTGPLTAEALSQDILPLFNEAQQDNGAGE